MKKKISLILATTLVLSIFSMQGYAYNSNTFVPPGLAKKGGLPPGLAKKETLPPGWEKKVNLSENEESIEQIGLKGIVKEVNKNTLKIQMNIGLFTLEIEDDAVIKINGEIASLEDIHIGDEININMDDQNKVIAIRQVKENHIQFVTGKLLWIENKDKIVVKVNEEIKTYSLADPVKVYIHDQIKNLEDLKENEIIKIRVEGNKVTAIIWNPEVIIEDIAFKGAIYAVDKEQKEIILKNEKTIKLFKIHEDTIIKINGETTNFEDLQKGMSVQVFFEEDQVVKILGENLVYTYEGRLIRIESGLQDEITIELKDGTKEFIIDKDVEIITSDGEKINFVALFNKIKSQIKIKTENNQVVRVEIKE